MKTMRPVKGPATGLYLKSLPTYSVEANPQFSEPAISYLRKQDCLPGGRCGLAVR